MPMSPSDKTSPFSDEELLALLKDPSVSPDAIAAEMEDAGAASYPIDQLVSARAILASFDPQHAVAIETLVPVLRSLVLDQAIAVRASDLFSALAKSGDKAIVKEAKRGLHTLKTLGVKIEAPPAAPVTAQVGSAGQAIAGLPAFMAAPDGFGDRVLLYPVAMRNGIDMAQVIVSDTRGVMDAALAPLGRKEYRRYLTHLAMSKDMLVAEAPRTYVRGLITRALDLNARARTPVPPSFNDVSFVLGPACPPEPSPGRKLPLPEGVEVLAAQSGEMLEWPELRRWMPPNEVVQSLALRVDEISVSPLYIDDAQRDQTTMAAVRSAVAAFWTNEVRELWAERVFDLAHVLDKVSRGTERDMALATAQSLATDRPIDAIGFCAALFERVLAALAAQAEPEAPKPAETVTPSGLILPG